MPTVEKRKGLVKEKKAKINFDVNILNTMIKYLRCEYVTAEERNTMYKLFSNLNIEAYRYNPDIYDRVILIQSVLEAVVGSGLNDPGIVRSFVLNKVPDSEQLLDAIGFDQINRLSSKDCSYMSAAILERYQYLEIYKAKDDIINLLKNIDNSSYEVSYYSLVQELKNKLALLISNLQPPVGNVGLIREFSFSSDDFANLIDVIVKKRKMPSSILQTGMRQLNAILAPGFQSSRFYVILGGSGRFKSGTLLNISDQIRLYNPQVIAFVDGRRKCILFITLENSIEESIERVYDMYSGVNDDLRDKDTKDVIDALRGDGQFVFTNDSGIDIVFKYYSNLEINTGAIYGMIDNLRDRGKEVICVVLDYIKRIDSVHQNNGDERLRMSFVAKELKSIAQFYEIPVISAMQLNREGNSIIDAAMRENKQDVARFVGSSSIGNAWDIIEDSDWVCLINLEMQRSSERLFLTFKRLKMRGKSKIQGVDYFNHPFINEKNIRLEPDVDKENPVSIISLASDLESIIEKEPESKYDRPRISNMRLEQENRKLTPLQATGINLSAL